MRWMLAVPATALAVWASSFVFADSCGTKSEGSCTGKTAAVSSCKGECGKTATLDKRVTENAAYRQANDLVKSWKAVPAKLVSMNETDKSSRMAAVQHMMDSCPTAAEFKPTYEFVAEALVTAEQLDQAAEAMCEGKCEKGDEGSCCTPETKAKAAAQRAFIAKANEVMLASAAAARAQSGCCKGDEAIKDGSCCKLNAKTASFDGKCEGEADGKCDSKGGSCESKVKTTSAKGSCTDGGSCGTAKAQTVAAKTSCTDGASCSDKAKTAGAEAKVCPKAATASAMKLLERSDKLMKDWKEAEAKVASMTDTQREEATSSLGKAMASCPAGSLMPSTCATVADLLREANKIDPKCGADKPAEAKKLIELRGKVLTAALNALDKLNGTMTSNKRVATAG